MKQLAVALAILGLFSISYATAADVGKPAPEFTLQDSNGKKVSLADYKGKVVVLEWVNFNCPFVKKFYGAGAIQKLQEEYTGKGVIWLSINSSAAGKEGNFTPAEINERIKSNHGHPTAYLIDESGIVGKSYGAKTTPHIFIIGKDGVLLYAGAIDSIKSTDPADIPKAENYAQKALDEILTGKPVSTATTVPYGCGVKY